MEKLVQGFREGNQCQTLLGVTGSGKTFTMANIIEKLNKGFEINVSKYHSSVLYRARHTDELFEDGHIHVRIDYKVSGLGSNACGPALSNKYCLDEKNIEFSFSIKPQ